ncbi:MAG: hypothetical protein JO079_11150 [Frankiaceae bacterium]|nr:hypothetical protein [Frankiaceae bacterium]
MSSNHQLEAFSFAKSLVAELEASMAAAMIVDPDPDPEASWKAIYPAIFGAAKTKPFEVSSITTISANMRSALLSWQYDHVKASFFAPTAAAGGQPIFEVLSSREGSSYDYSEAELRRLGAELRRFFHGKTNQLIRRS